VLGGETHQVVGVRTEHDDAHEQEERFCHAAVRIEHSQEQCVIRAEEQ
jgi:hypothetical protein